MITFRVNLHLTCDGGWKSSSTPISLPPPPPPQRAVNSSSCVFSLVFFFCCGEWPSIRNKCIFKKKGGLQLILKYFKRLECMLIWQGACHDVALPFTFTRILREKKNYENSNISPCKNVIYKKSSERHQNPSRIL
jgi:hypothetical protein